MSVTNRQVTVDGLTIETTDQGAQVIEKLQEQLRKANEASVKVLADHATAMAAKDSELAKRDSEIVELKKKVLADADIDKMVAARATLLESARLVAKDAKYDGLSDADIRSLAVKTALGDEVVKDKAPAYIDARFEILVDEARKKAPKKESTALGNVLREVKVGDEDPRSKARVKMITELNPQPAKAN